MPEHKEPEPSPPSAGPGIPVLPDEEPRDAHYNPQPDLLHANADFSAIVPGDSDEAAFVINPKEPGKRGGRLLEEHRAAKREAKREPAKPGR